jgi:hypothetical protein
VNATAIVRIPDTPARLLRLCELFEYLAAHAIGHGQPWPESLDAWSELLQEWRASA